MNCPRILAEYPEVIIRLIRPETNSPIALEEARR